MSHVVSCYLLSHTHTQVPPKCAQPGAKHNQNMTTRWHTAAPMSLLRPPGEEGEEGEDSGHRDTERASFTHRTKRPNPAPPPKSNRSL